MTKTAKFMNSVDPDEVAHDEPPHQDLHCLSSILWILNIIELENEIFEIVADVNFVVCFLVLKELRHLQTTQYYINPTYFYTSSGAPIAQWVKRWPTDLGSWVQAQGETFSTVNGVPLHKMVLIRGCNIYCKGKKYRSIILQFSSTASLSLW